MVEQQPLDESKIKAVPPKDVKKMLEGRPYNNM